MPLHQDYMLQVSGLSKTFSGIKALDNVQLDLKRGEVHALMGENGAGKSTFMRILIGLLSPDSGEISFNGKILKNEDVRGIAEKGISMIHQEMLVVPELTVAQTIFLGRETTHRWFGWLNDRMQNKAAADLLARMGIDLDPRTKIKQLRVAEIQMVEIAKALSNNAQIIIMDEPTSALSDKEVATLFRLIGELKQQGVAVIYISHKMDEIAAIADRITVLRDGKYVGTRQAAELDPAALITMMVGREIDSLFPTPVATKGPPVLSVRNLRQQGKFADITFDIQAGEVLGVAGLMGAGRTEIARALFGLDRLDGGDIYIKGQPVVIRTPADAIRQGIGYVSEDRKQWGFIPGMSVQDNITLATLPRHSRGIFVQPKRESAVAAKLVGELAIKTSGLEQKVKYLSGGNQQKVVIAKVLLASPDLLILDEPTRGIDIGAKAEIYKLIHQLTAQGIAVLMISSELPELLGMSDRILVIARGKQTALLPKEGTTQETIMQYAMQD